MVSGGLVVGKGAAAWRTDRHGAEDKKMMVGRCFGWSSRRAEDAAQREGRARARATVATGGRRRREQPAAPDFARQRPSSSSSRRHDLSRSKGAPAPLSSTAHLPTRPLTPTLPPQVGTLAAGSSIALGSYALSKPLLLEPEARRDKVRRSLQCWPSNLAGVATYGRIGFSSRARRAHERRSPTKSGPDRLSGRIRKGAASDVAAQLSRCRFCPR